MTDARLPERWLMDRRINRLSDREFRAFVMSLMWSVSNRTDGRILPEDLPLIPGAVSGADADALVKVGLWDSRNPGWQITDFGASQTSRHELEVLENMRLRERQKKSRQRAAARKAAESEAEKPADQESVPGDSPGDVSPGTAQARTGQARTGKERRGKESDLEQNWPAWQGNGNDPYEEYK